jgi:hypothetical protein
MKNNLQKIKSASFRVIGFSAVLAVSTSASAAAAVNPIKTMLDSIDLITVTASIIAIGLIIIGIGMAEKGIGIAKRNIRKV